MQRQAAINVAMTSVIRKVQDHDRGARASTRNGQCKQHEHALRERRATSADPPTWQNSIRARWVANPPRQADRGSCQREQRRRIAGGRAVAERGGAIGQKLLIDQELRSKPPHLRQEKPDRLRQACDRAEPGVPAVGVGDLVQQAEPQELGVAAGLVKERRNQDRRVEKTNDDRMLHPRVTRNAGPAELVCPRRRRRAGRRSPAVAADGGREWRISQRTPQNPSSSQAMPIPTQARSINVKLRGNHRLSPAACRADRCREERMQRRARARCRNGWSDAGLFELEDQRRRAEGRSGRRVSSRSSRGKGASATSGIIARDAKSAIACDQEPHAWVACRPTSQAQPELRKSAVDRVASNKTGPALSSHTHMPRTFAEEPLSTSRIQTGRISPVRVVRGEDRGASQHGKKIRTTAITLTRTGEIQPILAIRGHSAGHASLALRNSHH